LLNSQFKAYYFTKTLQLTNFYIYLVNQSGKPIFYKTKKG